jgi:hypothetical protein
VPLAACLDTPDTADKLAPLKGKPHDAAYWDKVAQICQTEFPAIEPLRVDSSLALLSWIGLWVLASIPIYVMCCCTPNPARQQEAAADASVAAVRESPKRDVEGSGVHDRLLSSEQ